MANLSKSDRVELITTGKKGLVNYANDRIVSVSWDGGGYADLMYDRAQKPNAYQLQRLAKVKA